MYICVTLHVCVCVSVSVCVCVCVCVCERERERERERGTERQTDRWLDGQMDRRTDGQTDRQTYRQTGRQAGSQTQTEKDCLCQTVRITSVRVYTCEQVKLKESDVKTLTILDQQKISCHLPLESQLSGQAGFHKNTECRHPQRDWYLLHTGTDRQASPHKTR